MLQILRPLYYFKNMDKFVENHYRSCEICIKNKSRTARPIGKLSKLGPATEPFEIMSLDTVGGFGGLGSPKRYMHILVDHFTRKAYISTSKHQTAREMIKLIDKVAKDNHIEMILVDHYSALESKQLKDFLDERNTRLIFTSVDCAASNGLNERLNQTLVNRIRCKKNAGDRRAWAVIAQECLEEYNKTPHTVTKFAPDYLMFGCLEDVIPTELKLKRDIHLDRAEAFRNSERNFLKNKARIDKNRKSTVFQKGDWVYVHNGSKLNRRKLDEIRSGPYMVEKRISNSIYEIRRDRRGKQRILCHSSKLTPVPSQT